MTDLREQCARIADAWAARMRAEAEAVKPPPLAPREDWSEYDASRHAEDIARTIAQEIRALTLEPIRSGCTPGCTGPANKPEQTGTNRDGSPESAPHPEPRENPGESAI